MIPAHFLRSNPNSNNPSNSNHNTNSAPTNGQNHDDAAATGPTVTVTIKRPSPGEISFPPAPNTVGKVTETITKSTFTETVVTRVTDNKLVLPLISEVSESNER